MTVTENGSSAPALTLNRTMPTSVFAEARERVYKYRFDVGLYVGHLVGGVPTDPNKIEGWLRSKVEAKDEIIREMVAEAIVDRGLQAAEGESADDVSLTEKAIADVVANKHLNGFKRLPDGTLYIEGRQVKAMIKEAANIRWPANRWGPTKKGTKNFFAEHLFVMEDILPIYAPDEVPDTVAAPNGEPMTLVRPTDLGRVYIKPTDIQQRFVQSRFGSSITLEEFVEPALIRFTLFTDHEFSKDEFGELFVTGETNGLGASRSQGYGRFAVVEWRKQK